MRLVQYLVLTGAVAIGGLADGQSAKKSPMGHESDRDRLIGAWRLVQIDAPGPGGASGVMAQPHGMLIYTRDGHISVQLMYPKAAKNLSNEYVQDGYEASFGSYEVDERSTLLLTMYRLRLHAIS